MRVGYLDNRDLPGNRFCLLRPLWIDSRPEWILPTFRIPDSREVIDPWSPARGAMLHATIMVPSEYKYDKASIPKLVRSWLSEDTERAACIHDWICQYRNYGVLVAEQPYYIDCSRLFGDRLFCAICKHDGVSWWRRQIMFAALITVTAFKGFP